MKQKQKKLLNKYIKENLSKGYSLKAIRKAFLNHGYNPDFVEYLIRSYKIKNIIIKTSPVLLVLLLIIPTIFFYKSGITTFAVITKQYNFTDNIGLSFNESTDYIWNLENKGILKSIKLNGEVKINGTVKIYLEHENKTYLIFDNKKLGGVGLGQITGFAVSVNNIYVDIVGNLTSEQQSVLDDLIININETRNNVEIEIEVENNTANIKIDGSLIEEQSAVVDELIEILKTYEHDIKIKIKSDFQEIEIPEDEINDIISNETLINETLNVTEPTNDTINITPINITNETIINETIINETIENISVNKINIKLEYKKDSIYDIDNNGIENFGRVVDLTVENTEFNFEVKEENLCTRWDTYSVENEESTIVCYGGARCCSFVDLAARYNWNEPFYSAYGQYGATLNNAISAQVLLVDYNLSLEDPYTEIYYSEWNNLTTQFYELFTIFDNICIETCILPNLNSISYKLIIEINNSGIILDSINYIIARNETINSPPVLLKNFSDISFFTDQNYTINLSEYFYDEDNDTLIFIPYNNSDINTSILNQTATLKTLNYTGKTYMFFIANDSVDTVVSNIFEVEVKEHKIGPVILKSLRKLIGLG